MYVLLQNRCPRLSEGLAVKFPGVPIHAVTTEAEIRSHAGKMDILITIFRVSDETFKEAVNLKWIQALTTGVNYIINRPSLRKEVIVTSCRGILRSSDV
jgi:phosphoglycerate dehydrogenase-like enzyme